MQNADGRRERAQAGAAGHRRPDQPDRHRNGAPGGRCRRAPSASSRRARSSSSPTSIPNQQGVPVTGSYDDGPEWGTQPFTNMFASDHGSIDPKYPVNTLVGGLPEEPRWHRPRDVRLRDLAVVRRRGQRSGRVVQGTPAARSASMDTSVPFGGANFTSAALIAKQNGVDAMTPSHGQQLELRPRHGAQAGRGEAQGHPVRHRLRARRDQLTGLVDAAGRLLPQRLPPVVAAQRRHPADAGGHGEVRPLQQDPIRRPSVRPNRGSGPTS